MVGTHESCLLVMIFQWCLRSLTVCFKYTLFTVMVTSAQVVEMSPTVLFRTTVTQMLIHNLLVKTDWMWFVFNYLRIFNCLGASIYIRRIYLYCLGYNCAWSTSRDKTKVIPHLSCCLDALLKNSLFHSFALKIFVLYMYVCSISSPPGGTSSPFVQSSPNPTVPLFNSLPLSPFCTTPIKSSLTYPFN